MCSLLRRRALRGVIFALAALAAFGLSLQVGFASALEEGRIGILYVGCIARSQSWWLMKLDPLFSINFVQATLRDFGAFGPIQQASSRDAVRRFVRLYMPRSYSHLIDRFDVIIMQQANRDAVIPRYIEMMAKGVREAGMGLFMDGGWESFGGSAGRLD